MCCKKYSCHGLFSSIIWNSAPSDDFIRPGNAPSVRCIMNLWWTVSRKLASTATSWLVLWHFDINSSASRCLIMGPDFKLILHALIQAIESTLRFVNPVNHFYFITLVQRAIYSYCSIISLSITKRRIRAAQLCRRETTGKRFRHPVILAGLHPVRYLLADRYHRQNCKQSKVDSAQSKVDYKRWRR